MHFFIFVITSWPPTEQVLNTVLAPFYPEKLDWHTLGGRYTGLLIPHRAAKTMIGGSRAPEIEQRYDAIDQLVGITFRRPGQTGPGVDAVRFGNLKDIHGLSMPRAVVVDDTWHDGSSCPNLQAIGMGIRYGLLSEAAVEEMMSSVDADVLQKERDSAKVWGEAVHSLLCTADDREWLAVVDCHI
jgi:hypothetical protein